MIDVVCCVSNQVEPVIRDTLRKNQKLYCYKNQYRFTEINSLNYLRIDEESIDNYSLVINNLCMFVNLDQRIEDFINELDYLYFPLYKPSEKYETINNYICSDSFIIKHSLWSKNFINEWIKSKIKISEFIEKYVDIGESFDVQYTRLLNPSFRICANFFDVNNHKHTQAMLLNLSNTDQSTVLDFVSSYNKSVGIY